MSHFKFLATLSVSLILLGACSTASSQSDVSDPLEGFNRGVLKFNTAVDNVAIKPVAKAYRAVVPQPARTGVRNALRNLKTPQLLANDLLQGDLTGAANTTTRFVANTLFGLGGFIDIAGAEGVKYEEEDFGQTLGFWGVGHGAYVMLPLMGPSSLRDATGTLVDTYSDPIRLWSRNTDNEEVYYSRVGIATIDKREELLDVLDDLQKNSVDYYTALKSSYIQRRAALVTDEGRGATDLDLPDIP
jgi:phospholipid-binding lipoprotein MlaA